MDLESASDTQAATPTVRLFALLEAMAALSCHFTLQDLVRETGLPKASVHRMLHQLESAGIVQRDGDDRHYGLGGRMRHLAGNLLMKDSLHGARHAVLLQLREEVGESCNLTALSGGEVIYLDRVETVAPLRFYLHPGSRVPAHCSATGKLFLAQLPPRNLQQLLRGATLERYTANTIVDARALELELARCRQLGYGIDNEEFLPGLVCLAVLVPGAGRGSNLGVAMQGPSVRLNPAALERHLPALHKAAQALARLEHTDTGAPPPGQSAN